MIKITGGTLRGRPLVAEVPEGVRPTSSRTREALFSILGQDLADVSFLDAFGGSGCIAIEAWSRGAAPVIVVERNVGARAAIGANAASLKVPLDVRTQDAAALVDAAGAPLVEADVVYLDPPFDQPIGEWITRLAPCARHVLVAEARKGAEFPEAAGALPLDRVRAYGDSVLAVYRR